MGGNDAKKSGFRPYKRFLLSLGGLSSAVESLFVLFGYAYLRTALPPYLAALIAVIAAAAAIALVPAMHATVNRVRSLTLGRYHGMLVLASVLAPVACSFLFNIDFGGSAVYRALAAAVSLFLLFLSVQTFSYAAYSIGTGATDGRIQPALGYVMNGLGVAIVVVLGFFYFYYGEEDGLGRMAYLIGGLTALSGLAVYFSTFSLIPKFIHTEPALFGLREDYRRFFVRPFPVAALYLGRYFFTAALLTVAMYAAVLLCGVLGCDSFLFKSAIAAAAVCGVAVRVLVRTQSPAGLRTSAVAAFVLLGCAVCAVWVLPYFKIGAVSDVYTVIACAVAAGCAYGLVSVAQNGYMAGALSLTGASRGTHKCMTGILTCGAAGTAFFVCGLLDCLQLYKASVYAVFVTFSAVCVLFMALGLHFSEKGMRFAVLYGRPETDA